MSSMYLWLCLIYVVQFCFQSSFDLLSLPIPLFILQIGGQNWHPGLLNAIFAVGILAFRPRVAFLIERYRAPRVLFGVAAVATVSPLLHLLSQNIYTLALNRLLYAIVPAAFIIAIQLLIVEVTGTRHAGKYLGLFGAVGGLSYLITPTLAFNWTLGVRGFEKVAQLSSLLAAAALVGSLLLMVFLFGTSGCRSSLNLPSKPLLSRDTGLNPAVIFDVSGHIFVHLIAAVWFGLIFTYFPVLLSVRNIDQGGVFFMALPSPR